MAISRRSSRLLENAGDPTPSRPRRARVARVVLVALVGLVAATLAVPWARAADEEAAEGSHGDLDWTVGSWQGSRGDGTDASRSPLTLRIEPILGGVGYTEALEVTDQGGVYRGFATAVYDVEEGVWVRQYVNAVRGHFTRLDGVIDGYGSTWRITTPGRTRESRLVVERVDADHWRRTHSISEDGGETWRILWEDRLERVPAPSEGSP